MMWAKSGMYEVSNSKFQIWEKVWVLKLTLCTCLTLNHIQILIFTDLKTRENWAVAACENTFNLSQHSYNCFEDFVGREKYAHLTNSFLFPGTTLHQRLMKKKWQNPRKTQNARSIIMSPISQFLKILMSSVFEVLSPSYKTLVKFVNTSTCIFCLICFSGNKSRNNFNEMFVTIALCLLIVPGALGRLQISTGHETNVQ